MKNDLLTTLRKHLDNPNFHPAILLAEVSQDEDEDMNLRVNCAKTLLPYIEATHKSVEIKASVDHTIGLLKVNFLGQNKEVIDGTNGKLIEDAN